MTEEERKFKAYNEAVNILMKFYNENNLFRCPERRAKGTDTMKAERVVRDYNNTEQEKKLA